MSSYTRLQMEAFLDNLITDNNFHILSKILLLSDNELLSKTLDYLYEYKISLFDLANIEIFDENSLTIFLNNFDNKFTPPSFINNLTSTFNSNIYLEGISSGFTDLVDIFKNYNNENNSLSNIVNRKNYTLDVLVGKPDKISYVNLNDFQNDFNTKILPLILTEFSITNIRELFPLKNNYTVLSSEVTNIRDKYDSIFNYFLDSLDNLNFYKMIFTINSDTSLIFNNAMQFYNLMNFKEHLGKIIPSMYFNTVGTCNSLGRKFNITERDVFKNYYLDTLLDVDLQNAFAWIKFYYTLTSLINDDLNLPIDSQYKNDLDNLVTKINLFKELIEFTFTKSSQLLKIKVD